MDLSQYISLNPIYDKWSDEAALPDLPSGPTAVPYSVDRAKSDNLNLSVNRCAESAIGATLSDIINHLNASSFTEKDLLSMISLILSLKNKENQYVFSVPSANYFSLDTGNADSTIPVPTSSGDVLTTGQDLISTALNRSSESRIPEASYSTIITEDTQIINAGPYWACSFIRLISKEPESWRRAMGAIKMQYGTFYGSTSKFITSYTPTISHAQQVRTAMDTFRRVSRILVAIAATTEKSLAPNSKSHHMFIYFMGQHMAFTGMNTYPVLTSIIHRMKAMKPAQILSLLTIEENRPSIKMYHDIATTCDAPSGKSRENRDYLWKYARLINEGFFLQLQNKRNVELLYGLILLSKKLGISTSNTYADPENMAILKGREIIKEEAMEFAEAVYMLYKSQVATGPEATGTDRFLAIRRGINIRQDRPVAEKRATTEEVEPMHVEIPTTHQTAAEPSTKKARVNIDQMLSGL